jgi:hypothetical protein
VLLGVREGVAKDEREDHQMNNDMNRHDRRRAGAQRRKMDAQSLIHDDKNIKVVLDLSGNQPMERLEINGVLTEDAEVVDLEGDETIKLVAQCSDLTVIGFIVKPKARETLLDQFKKGMAVRLAGLFSPTTFERHEDTDILKPILGTMIITHGSVRA